MLHIDTVMLNVLGLGGWCFRIPISCSPMLSSICMLKKEMRGKGVTGVGKCIHFGSVLAAASPTGELSCDVTMPCVAVVTG